MLKRLDNIGVAVRDLPQAYRFYTEVLGFEASPLVVEEGGFSARLGDMSLYIFTTTGLDHQQRNADLTTNPPGIDHIAFEAEDFEAAQAELVNRGVRFVQEVVGNAGEFRYRGFHDPEGNMLYIVDTGASA